MKKTAPPYDAFNFERSSHEASPRETGPLIAGACQMSITPDRPMFLYGYPNVPRVSTGVHDPLMCSALFLDDGKTRLLIIGNDIIWINNQQVRRLRKRLAKACNMLPSQIMITASHTHSGPMTTQILSNRADKAVPPVEPTYLAQLEDRIVETALYAHDRAVPAEIGLHCADGSCVGTHRRDPAGVSNPQVPVLAIRRADTQAWIALMLVCSMHPTVLHEDSTLISADFPGMTRQYLQQETMLGRDCPIVYHMGASGNQSPRHVTRANTFEEAKRLGCLLGKNVASAIEKITYESGVTLACRTTQVTLEPRVFPTVEHAMAKLEEAQARYEQIKTSGRSPQQIRTAECDLFGCQETVALSQAAQEGLVAEMVEAYNPVEIQILRIGRWSFVGWPGEVFVEFALDVMNQHPDCFIITLANGELQGYLVTEEAVREAGYEASNALFASPGSGQRFVQATQELLAAMP